MKAKIYSLLLVTALIAFGCNPIEDESLREQYFENAGTPITVEELNAALSVTQPIPNAGDKLEGDQYVVLKNSRPDVGGAWHYTTSTGVKTSGSDNNTIIYSANGEYDIYYEGISANQIVRSKTFHVTVTNCFDEYDRILSGAENKVDLTAKKVWTFANAADIVYEGGHGAWKALAIAPGMGKWWQDNIPASVREQTMVFEFAGHKLSTYSNTGTLLTEGGWAYTHETPEATVGELITTIPVIGNAFDAYTKRDADKGSTTYWILKIDEKELVIYHPELYTGAGDWDNDGYYYFFKAKE